MSGMENGVNTVTLRVNRFAPRAERARDRERGGSPFARKSSPFGDSGMSARRRPRGKQWLQDYTLNVRPEDTVLDCLLKIKRTIDATLAFRYSCGHGMCGSDAVSINGTPTLLCTATIRDWAKQPGAMPEVDDEGEVEIRDEDIRIDVYRSSGAGGQKVNKTETAIRITHFPTGIVVTCQNERSQLQNKAMAFQYLRAKLIERQIAEREAADAELKGEIKKIEWGSQIRSYVFCPYTLAKDHRTGYEMTDIQGFIIDYLKKAG